MKFRYLFLASLLFASACTIAPQGSGVETEFHPPLSYQDWQVKQYTLANGARTCTVSSGYNGLTVVLKHTSGAENISVQSNRPMEPGTTLTVNADGRSFEAYSSVFPSKTVQSLVEHLSKGGKAYLEWSEIAGPTAERIHVQNIVRLDNFSAGLQQCRDALTSKR